MLYGRHVSGLLLSLLVAAGCQSTFGPGATGPGDAADSSVGHLAAGCKAPPSDHAPTMLVQEGHAKDLASAVLSADGRVLATSARDGTVRIWDTQTGLLVRRFAAQPTLVDATMSGDASMLVFSGVLDAPQPTAVAIVDLIRGSVIRMAQAARFALSPDGRLMAVPSAQGGVDLVETRSGRGVGHIALPAALLPATVAFHPKGDRLAIGQVGRVAVADVKSGAIAFQRDRTPANPADGIDKIQFAGDSVVAMSRQSGVEVFAPDGTSRKFPGPVMDAAATADRLWTVAGALELKAWDLKTGKPVSPPEPSRNVERVVASADGSTLVILSKDWLLGRVMHIMDVRTMQTVRTIEGRNASVVAAAFAPDGKQLATRGTDSSLTLWDLGDGRMLGRHRVGMRLLYTDSPLAFDSTGQFVVTGSVPVMVVHAASGRVARQWKAHGDHDATFAAVLPGSKLITAGRDGRVVSWDLAGTQLPRQRPAHAHVELARPPSRELGKVALHVTSAALSPDGMRIALLGQENQVAVMDLGSGKLQWQAPLPVGITLQGASPMSMRAAFDSKGRLLVSGNDVTVGNVLRVYAAKDGAVAGNVKLPTAGALAATRRVILVGGAQPVLLDAKTLQVRQQIRTVDTTVTSVTADPQKNRFVLGGDSGATSLVSAKTGEVQVVLVSTPGGEYLAATHQGAYRASIDGARAIAWSYTEPLEGFAFDQFAAGFELPQVIEQRLAGKRAAAPGRVSRPPRVCLDRASYPPQVDARTITVRPTVASTSAGGQVRVYVNGRMAAEQALSEKVQTASVKVPLSAGRNRLAVIATNEAGFASNPQVIDVESTAKVDKPALWVISVGVSRYPNLAPEHQLEVADDDAQAIAAALSQQAGAGGQFSKVHAVTLVDSQVTVKSVEQALEQLSKMKPDDLAVVFLAGHGVRIDEGKMVFLTSRASLKRAAAKRHGIGWDRIEALLQQAQGRVLMLLDACHSGHISVENIALNDRLAASLAAGGRSGVVVFAAARGRQLSYEVSATRGSTRGLELAWDGAAAPVAAVPSKGHGLFTAAVLEALAGKAPDRDESGAIELGEFVGFVTERVRSASNGRQTPWVARREMFGDFVVASAK